MIYTLITNYKNTTDPKGKSLVAKTKIVKQQANFYLVSTNPGDLVVMETWHHPLFDDGAVSDTRMLSLSCWGMYQHTNRPLSNKTQ